MLQFELKKSATSSRLLGLLFLIMFCLLILTKSWFQFSRYYLRKYIRKYKIYFYFYHIFTVIVKKWRGFRKKGLIKSKKVVVAWGETCTHIFLGATEPEHCYLLYVHHRVVARLQQLRTTQRTWLYFCGLFCVILVIVGP